MTRKKQKVKNKSVIIALVVMVLSYACTEKVEPLPRLGHHDIEFKTVDGKEVADTIYHTVPEFKYLNQDSIWVSSGELKGKVWVTDFFFSNCPTICPPMTSQMKRLNFNTKDLEEKVQYLSFSIDPKRDQPTRLREYIELHGIESNNWYFMTGVPADKTHEMAGSYFNYAKQDDEVPGGFGHTSYFAIVDTKGFVRGIYDGTNTLAVDSLERDLRKLLKYEYNFEGRKSD